jgi:putative transcriptional regulator
MQFSRVPVPLGCTSVTSGPRHESGLDSQSPVPCIKLANLPRLSSGTRTIQAFNRPGARWPDGSVGPPVQTYCWQFLALLSPPHALHSKGPLTFRLMLSNLYIMKNEIREQRRQRGLSQVDLAAGLGVSRQTVIAIESGRYSPSLPLAFRIARFFDVPVDMMFDPEEETEA